MQSIIKVLNEFLEQSKGRERQAISYILQNPEACTQMSIHEIAEKTECSTATILRVCKRAGAENFKNFKLMLMADIAVGKETIDLESQIEKGDNLEEILEKISLRNIASIKDTVAIVDRNMLQKSVDAIVKGNTIVTFGIGASYLVSQDLCLKFLRLGKKCMSSADWHTQRLFAQNMKKDDVAIMFSYSGSTEEMVTCAKYIKESGAVLIAVTKMANSPLAKLADYCLHVPESEGDFRSGAMASRIAQLNLVDIIYVAYINSDFETNAEHIKKTHHRKEKRNE